MTNAVDDALGTDHFRVFNDVGAVPYIWRDDYRLACTDFECLVTQRDSTAARQTDSNLFVWMRMLLRTLTSFVFKHTDLYVVSGN